MTFDPQWGSFCRHSVSVLEPIDMDERLSGIEAFVQAVEAGSFARAAEKLGLTRSAVGKSVARLEQRLGARLFHRTTRAQSLTEDGHAFYERCRRALDEIDAAEAALDAGRREPAGRLRVSVPLLFGRHCVAPVLARLARRYPRLDLEIAFSDRVADLLEDGFDLAVRIGELRDSPNLAARRLGAQTFAVCAAPSYLGKRKRPVRAEDFASMTAITYSRAGAELPWEVRDAHGRRHTLPIARHLRFDDVQAIADAALAGFGVARLPHWLIAPLLQSGALLLLMEDVEVETSDVHAVWPHSRYLPSKTRAAIDALAAEVPALLGSEARVN
jgi:DNA-binding transcriptional LysR family regulator